MDHLWLATLLLSVLSVSGQLELRTVLADCLSRGSELNSCLIDLSKELRPYMVTGIPSLNIPVTEPMDIDRIAFELKSPLGTVNVEFTDNSVAGLSDHEILDVNADKLSQTIAVEILVNNAVATGMYHMTGSLGPVELDPKLKAEPYRTVFTGTRVTGLARLGVVDGRLAIVEEPEVEVDVTGLDVTMENLFGGEAPGLAKVILRVVNNDSKKFIQDFQPEIRKQVSQLIKEFYNSALANLPVETFL